MISYFIDFDIFVYYTNCTLTRLGRRLRDFLPQGRLVDLFHEEFLLGRKLAGNKLDLRFFQFERWKSRQ